MVNGWCRSSRLAFSGMKVKRKLESYHEIEANRNICQEIAMMLTHRSEQSWESRSQQSINVTTNTEQKNTTCATNKPI